VVFLVASCSAPDTPNPIDGATVDHLDAVNDLADLATPDSGPSDIAVDRTDAGFDVPLDVGPDVIVDRPAVTPDRVDSGLAVRLVDVGGILLPIDPDGVPAPGSECVGDGGARKGDPTVEAPRPVRPQSVSRVTSQRPTFQWILPAETTGARIEICADRCCTRAIQTIDADGTTTRPSMALPPGVVFWRMFGRRGASVGSRASYTWEFEVRRRDAPNDTSWGTVRDFNGDGFDDLIAFRMVDPEDAHTWELMIAAGSSTGLRAPESTGIFTSEAPARSNVGDYNGDGLADIAWNIRGPIRGPTRTEMMLGSTTTFRVVTRAETDAFPTECSYTGEGVTADWNGDGYSDLLTSLGTACFFDDPNVSVLLFYAGSSIGIGHLPQGALRLDGRFVHPAVLIGGALGDIDNDGYGDVVVRSVHDGRGTTSIPAEQIVLHGTPRGEPRIERIPLPVGDESYWQTARSKSAGDVDGDGYVDFSMSLNSSTPLYLYRHAVGTGVPSLSLYDPVHGPNFGFYVESCDVTGDGLADVVVSSDLAYALDGDRPVGLGRVYIFEGSPRGPSTTPHWVQRADTTTTDPRFFLPFGVGVSCPGDVNGDGIDDIVMGDVIDRRLCWRLGSVDFRSGSPDDCHDGVWFINNRMY